MRPAQDFDLGGGFHSWFHYSGSYIYPMVFQHSGAQDFDLGGGFHYSGMIVTQWCFNTVCQRPASLFCLDDRRPETPGARARPPKHAALTTPSTRAALTHNNATMHC
jgi:hypothetical protein